jgi:hypothetical protein
MKTIDNTIKALQTGLTELGVAKGIKNIESWMETLEKEEFRGAKTIHDNLAKLKRQLESDDSDGETVSELLNKLAEETKRAASHANGQEEKIAQLGEMLSSATAELSE